MTKSELIDGVLHEMDRVWGDEGLDGKTEEYEWLLKNYNISEEEDVQWQLILQHHMDDLPAEDQEDDEVMSFLEDPHAVKQFLQAFLAKYKTSSATYPREA
ncbi:hypothetical protein [Delftia tsuruhatensis]|uniref:hypothetical protein n=1 Tax=Delftia tsuruhatensis TaxID=180282 RepID=UPI0030CC913D